MRKEGKNIPGAQETLSTSLGPFFSSSLSLSHQSSFSHHFAAVAITTASDKDWSCYNTTIGLKSQYNTRTTLVILNILGLVLQFNFDY